MMLGTLVRHTDIECSFIKLSCRATNAAARLPETHRRSAAYEQWKRLDSPVVVGTPKDVTPSTAARTKLLLEGPILPTLLRRRAER